MKTYTYLLLFYFCFSISALLAQPIVNLGPDTTICGTSITLDAANAGASFVWSTGETTQTIVVSSDNSYWVDVTDIGGTTRDSVDVTFLTVPIITSAANDTSLCKGLHQLVAISNQGTVRWLDSLGQVVSLGDTLVVDIQQTERFRYAAGYFESLYVSYGVSSSITPSGYAGPDRGVLFDVFEYMRLDAVTIEVDNAAYQSTLELFNNQGQVLYTLPLSGLQVGLNILNLNYILPPGTGYELRISSISGGNNRYNLISNWSPYSYSFMNILGGAPFAAVNYFFDWQVSLLGDCTSSLDSLLVTALVTPSVDIRQDTTICGGSLVLDANDPSGIYDYNWNTGSSATQIVVSGSGLYQVSVSNAGFCEQTDSMNLTVIQPPVVLNATADTSLCKGLFDLVVASDQGAVFWLDSSGQVVSLGDTLSVDIQQSEQFWFKAGYFEPLPSLYSASSVGTPSGFVSADRGILFDVYEYMQLDAVAIEVDNAAFVSTIELFDNGGQIVYTKTVSGLQLGLNTINLNFIIPPGSGYELRMSSISGGNSRYDLISDWNPYTYSFMNIVGGVPFSAVNYFFDWQVSLLGDCASSTDSILITALVTPSIVLINDTTTCGTSVFLDATDVSGSFDYLWSTGATASSITAAATGTYVVSVSNAGFCEQIDSINLIVTQRPLIQSATADTSLCIGQYEITASSDVGEIRWLDSSGLVVSIGDTFGIDLQATERFWYKAGYFEPLPSLYSASSGGAPSGFVLADRGILFDVYEYMQLDAVAIEVDNAAFVSTIQLFDNGGQIVYTKTVSGLQLGLNTISLNFIIPPGSGYELRMSSISGGNSRYDLISDWNPYTYSFMNIVGGVPFSAVNYFFDWQVSLLGDCASSTDSINVILLPTPNVEFPTDSIVCNDTMIIDAFYAGAVYSWSTGSTNSSIVAIADDSYSVTSTIGPCFDSDSIDVYFVPSFNLAVLSQDTTTCAGIINRQAAGSDMYNWYDNYSGGNLIGTGNIFDYNAQVSDTIWVEGVNFSNKINTVGETDTFLDPQSDYYPISSLRGLVFDAHDDVYLQEVTVFIQDGSFLSAWVELWDENDVPIDSVPVFCFDGENVLPIGFNIPKGNNYKLMLTKYNISFMLLEFPYSGFPVVNDLLTIKEGIPFSTIYQYFYRWKIKAAACPSERLPSVVDVLPTPSINFPTDSIICGDTLVLDANYTGATSFLWSTGQTSSSIIIDQDTTVSLLATIGICTDQDSLNAFVVQPPDIIVPPADTTVCQGPLKLYASGNASYYAWYTDAFSSVPFALGDSILIDIQDTTTIWVEGTGFIPNSEQIGLNYTPAATSNAFVAIPNTPNSVKAISFFVNSPLILNSFKVYTDTLSTATLTIKQYNFPVYTTTLNFNNIGENLINLDYLFEPGAYSLELTNNANGKVLVYSPYSNLGQLNRPEITFTGTTPNNQWPCFFEWRISTPSCATARRSIQLDVPPTPKIEMTADTATCQLTNIVLDPLGNDPLYTYLWSDGSTADTLNVNSSGYYKVTVTNDGLCAADKDILVQFLTVPTAQFNNDTSICSSALLDLAQMSTDGIVVWYDSANLSSVQSITAPYSVYVQDDTSFWMDVAPRAVTRLGNQLFADPEQSSFYTTTTAEFRFDVFEYTVLDSVAMYAATAPSTFTLNLEDAAGNILYSTTHTILQAKQKVFIPLNYLLAPGADYDLAIVSPAPAYLANNIVLTDNSSNAGIASLKGGFVTSPINFTPFFDWHFSYAFPDCHTAADTFSVGVNIPIDLPDSLYTCDSVLLDAFDPNISSYNWSTGQTTAQVTLSSSGIYSLSFTDGLACNIIDTVQIYTPIPVSFPNSIAVCDSVLFSNYSANEASFVWSTGDTTVDTRVPG